MPLNWRAVTGDFAEVLYDLLTTFEGPTLNPVLIGGNLTIGLGFDLRVGLQALQDGVRTALGLLGGPQREFLAQTNPIAAAIETEYWNALGEAFNGTSVAALNTIMQQRWANTDPNYALAIPVVTRRQTFAFAGLNEVQTVYNAVLSDYLARINQAWPNADFLTNPAFLNSRERLVLGSLVWNGGAGLLQNSGRLLAALNANDRAEAWYQIRYRTNALGWAYINNAMTLGQQTAINAGIDRGLARRRYAEAEVLGLYDDSAATTEAEALKIYQMFTRHRGDMLRYEAAYGRRHDGVAGTRIDSIAQDTEWALPGGVVVRTLRDELGPAASQIYHDYLDAAGVSSSSVNVLNIQISATDNATLLGEDAAAHSGSNNDLLIAADGVTSTLHGQAGDDILVAGSGVDHLYGEAGFDTYVFANGNGLDVIGGDDNDGRVVFNGITVTGSGAKSVSLGVYQQAWRWQSGDEVFYFAVMEGDLLNGARLQILHGEGPFFTDAVTIEQFSQGDLGITLPVERSSVFLPEGATSNPFADPNFVPIAQNTTLLEGHSRTLTLAFNGSFGASRTVRIQVDGLSAVLRLVTGAETLSFQNGSVDLVLPSGQDMMTFALVSSGDVDADQSVNVTATLLDAAGAATPVGASLSVAFGAVAEAGPAEIVPLNLFDLSDPGPYASDDSDRIVGTEGTDVFNGGRGSDILEGRGGDDWIEELGDHEGDDHAMGGAGHDLIALYEGNDLLEGGTQSDIGWGGSGDDLLFAEVQVSVDQAIADGAVAQGGSGQGEFLVGQDGADLVVASDRDDYLGGGSGRDVLIGGGGNDFLTGDEWYTLGHDLELHGFEILIYFEWTYVRDITTNPDGSINYHFYLTGGGAFQHDEDGEADVIYAGTGNDDVLAGGGDDLVNGEAGDDIVLGEEGNDSLFGGAGNDVLDGGDDTDGTGKDFLDGGDGTDSIQGGGGDDTLFGGAGNDTLVADDLNAADGNDYLNGEAGDDVLFGGGGSDRLYGEGGNDVLNADAPNSTERQGADVLDGGDGNDILRGGGGADTLAGGAGADQLFGDSTNTPDSVHGNDALDGGADDDLLVGDGGADRLTGGSGADQLWGDRNGAGLSTSVMGADELDGGEGADQLVGGGGADRLVGGNGNDVLHGDDSTDRVAVSAHGNDLIEGGDGNDNVVGWGGNDTIFGGAGNDTLLGDQEDAQLSSTFHGNDVIDGGAGNDGLAGNGGDDILYGGDGDDVLLGDDEITRVAGAFHGNDYIVAGAGNDTAVGWGANDTLVGGEGNDVLVGDAAVAQLDAQFHGADTLDGQAGDDTLVGGGGDDVLLGGEGNDTLQGDDAATPSLLGNDSLDGGLGEDTLLGQAGDDILLGGEGNDGLSGGDGNDHLEGGAGDDTLDGGTGNDSLTGGEENDTLNAGDGNDMLEGGTGSDLLSGGAGDDVYRFGRGVNADRIEDSAGIDQIELGEGITATDVALYHDSVSADGDLILVLNGSAEQLRISRYFASSNAYRIESIKFADGTVWDVTAITSQVIDISGSSQLLTGTSGDDSFTIDHVNDVIDDPSISDNDTALSWVGYTLSNAVENLTLQGNLNLEGQGNTRDNVITGNVADNLLSGGGGADTLVGGAGDDTYTVDDFADVQFESGWDDGTDDVVVELANEGFDTVKVQAYSATLTANVERLVALQFSGNFYSYSPFSDMRRKFVGNDLNNIIDVTALSNASQHDARGIHIDGGNGSDIMIGGETDDTFVVNDVGDVVVDSGFNAQTGEQISYDTVEASIDYVLSENIECLRLTGSAAINGSGNALNNELDGSANSAANVLRGGSGNDRYILGAGDSLTENANEGNDTVVVTGAAQTYDLAGFQNIENLELRNAAGAADLLGDAGDNRLTGNASNNTIDGGDGNDTLTDANTATANDYDVLLGGNGNDTLLSFGGSDTLNGGAGDDLLQQAGATSLAGFVFGRNYGADTILAPTHNPYAYARITLKAGVAEEDINFTRDGQDLILTIDADSGSLRILSYFDDETSLVSQHALRDVYFSDGTWWNRVELDNRVRAALQPGVPSTGDDVIAGTSAADSIDAQDGNDVVFGSLGDDIIVGGEGADELHGEDGADELLGGSGNDVLVGRSGNDVLRGEAGDDMLRGGHGSDEYRFAAGFGQDTITDSDVPAEDAAVDTIVFESGINVSDIRLSATVGAPDLLIENTATGDRITVSNFYAAEELYNDPDHIEVIRFADDTEWSLSQIRLMGAQRFGTAGDDSFSAMLLLGTRLYGLAGNDYMGGGEGDDLLDGGIGSDYMQGGLGNDTFVVDQGGDQLIENANEGVDTVQSAITFTLGTNFENLTLTGTAAINATGNAAVNVLTGNSANNLLDGKAGADTLRGGDGNDTYIVDNIGDVIEENNSSGTDSVQASVSFTLAQNIENLTLTGTGALNGTGNASSNQIIGNSGANILDGGAGADQLSGGGGNDIYYVDDVGDALTENASAGTDEVRTAISFNLATNFENLTLLGSANLSGAGNSVNNILQGNAGNNTLDGGAGVDQLRGGGGDDTFIVDNTSDTAIENASEGTDEVRSSVTFTLGNNVENLTLTGNALINGTGNALDNILIGNSANNTLTGNNGNDTLDGQGGADSMSGGAGDDVYIVDNTSDATSENASAGLDRVNSSVARTLASNIELLFLTGTTAINGTGNTLSNLLRGNTASNTLVGGGGNDILEGGDGADILSNTAGQNLFNGGAGNDTLTGNTGKEMFIGGAGNDTLTTSTGADIIAFNRGDGQDVVNASTTRDNTVSLGNGMLYADLLFQKIGNDLILVTGVSEQITFKDYYLTAANRNVDKLQIIIEGTSDYDSGSSDATRNKKIETFNFEGLVSAFDAARAANPGLSSWALNGALTAQHLSGSDTAALGGDLAYRYGRFNTLSDISFTPALGILGASGFGTSVQVLQALGNLQDSSARLS